MLIALMTILFLGGGGASSATLINIANNQDVIEEVVLDEDRRDQAVETLKSMKKLAKDQNKAKKSVFKELETAFGEHESSANIVDAIWDDYYRQVNEFSNEAIDLRFQLKDQLTRDEWGQVFN